MQALFGSLYLVSTFAFSGMCLVIGARLLLLSRRTAGVPERLLGAGLGLGGGVGYGGLIAVMLYQVATGETTTAQAWIAALSKAAHNVGVMCTLAFILHVFRPDERWARVLAGAMLAVLWIGFAGHALAGGYTGENPITFWYWVEFSIIGTYPLWGAFEAFRYHLAMRRRLSMGLAEPIVVNRFLLWGVGSSLAFAAVWTIQMPAITGSFTPGAGLPAGAMLLTALFGLGTVGAYWLTFFPPLWYRARLAAA